MNSKNQHNTKANSMGKKLFIALLLTLTVSSGIFAHGVTDNNKIIAAFNTSFPEAKDVTWINNGDYVKGYFTWNNEKLVAIYHLDGTPIALSRTIDLKSLPLKSLKELQTKYQDYSITEAIEYDDEQEGLAYFVSMEKDSSKMILKISRQGDMSIFKKMKP